MSVALPASSRQEFFAASAWKTKKPTKDVRKLSGRRIRGRLITRAAQGDGRLNAQFEGQYSDFGSRARQTRLTTRVTTVPRRVDLYFAGNFLRKALWAFIAFCTGFYSANTVSLSFGALAVNDIVAAVVTVAFCELCSKAYYSAARPTLKLIFVNCFKMGVTTALISDAFKLAG